MPKFAYEALQILALFVFPLIMIQVIGGIYYVLRLIQPPTISFKQATSSYWVIMSSLFFWMLMILSQTIARLMETR